MQDQTFSEGEFWDAILGSLSVAPAMSVPYGSLSGRTILVTGAGGSIGSALSRLLARAEVKRLILLDSSEHGLYQIDCDLDQATAGSAGRASLPHVAVLCDVSNRQMLNGVLDRHRPQIIFHTAACKQVPLMEENPFAAVLTNTIGTYHLADLAMQHGCEQLVLISTDKAVDPVSIMGASKRMAELVLLACSGLAGFGTQMKAIRLGNVLGSAGSVVPLFQRQISRGGPVTITHRDAERYFLTTERAVDLLLSALSGEFGNGVLVPSLGNPVKIESLARQMIARAGLPNSFPVEYIGLRPGEKLSESLISVRESYSTLGEASLRAVLGSHESWSCMCSAIVLLESAIREQNLTDMLALIQNLVPEYRPSEGLRAALAEGSSIQSEPCIDDLNANSSVEYSLGRAS